MGGISDLVVALSLLGLMQAWDAREEERTSRQEEVFVPFNLPPLSQQEQAIGQLTAADSSPVAVTRPVSHAWPTP